MIELTRLVRDPIPNEQTTTEYVFKESFMPYNDFKHFLEDIPLVKSILYDLQVSAKKGEVDFEVEHYTTFFIRKRNSRSVYAVNYDYESSSDEDDKTSYLLCYNHGDLPYHKCKCEESVGNEYSIVFDSKISLYKIKSSESSHHSYSLRGYVHVDLNMIYKTIIMYLFTLRSEKPFYFVSMYMRHYDKSVELDAFRLISNIMSSSEVAVTLLLTDDMASIIKGFYLSLLVRDIIHRYKILFFTTGYDALRIHYYVSHHIIENTGCDVIKFYKFITQSNVAKVLRKKKYHDAMLLHCDHRAFRLDTLTYGEYDTVFNKVFNA